MYPDAETLSGEGRIVHIRENVFGGVIDCVSCEILGVTIVLKRRKVFSTVFLHFHVPSGLGRFYLE